MEEIGISYFQAEQWFDKSVVQSEDSQQFLAELWNRCVERYPQLMIIEEQNGTLWMAIGDCHIIEVRQEEILMHREAYVPITRARLRTARFVKPQLLPIR